MINTVQSDPVQSKVKLQPILTAVMVGFFVTTLAHPRHIGTLPVQFLLKTYFHVKPLEMAGFFAVIAIPWYFKPLAGLLSDNVRLLGTQRRHYLLISTAAAALLWLALAVVPRQYVVILIILIGLNTMLMSASTVLGGILVAEGHRYKATGRLNSARMLVMSAATLIGGPLGGYLASRSLGLCGVIAATLLLIGLFFFMFTVREPSVMASAISPWKKMGEQARTVLMSRTLWRAAGMLFLLNIAPGFGTPLFYYQTNALHLTSQVLGTLALTNGLFGLLGAGTYGLLCRRLPLQRLLVIGITLNVVGTLCYLAYRSLAAALIIEGIYGFTGMLAALPVFDLAARATPTKCEGVGYAIMMSLMNVSSNFSDVFGSWLFGDHYFSLFELVWLNAGTTVLMLCIIPFLPQLLVRGSDDEAVVTN